MKCGMVGHFKIGCKKGKISNNDSAKEHNKVDEVFFIDTINNGKKGHWKKTLHKNEKSVSFKLDSGADLNVLPLDMLSKLGVGNNEIRSLKKLINQLSGSII